MVQALDSSPIDEVDEINLRQKGMRLGMKRDFERVRVWLGLGSDLAALDCGGSNRCCHGDGDAGGGAEVLYSCFLELGFGFSRGGGARGL